MTPILKYGFCQILPNQTFQTKPTKLNLPNQTYQTKPTNYGLCIEKAISILDHYRYGRRQKELRDFELTTVGIGGGGQPLRSALPKKTFFWRLL